MQERCVDEQWMQRALQLAASAQAVGEIPVGALLVLGDTCLGEGWNQVRMRHDPCAHAEIIAIQQAALRSQNERLPGATLYITLEPCAMCAGAILQARIARVVFGARDWRAGAAGSCLNVLNGWQRKPAVIIDDGIKQADCELMMKEFFIHNVRNTDQNG